MIRISFDDAFQGESIAKLTVKQSRLRVIDLGSNHFRTLPKALLKNSPYLNALYLDNNRLTNCSQMHTLRQASDLEFVDLSENRLVTLEKNCFDGLVAGVSIKLAGNPFQCSCETAAAVQWLAADGGHRGFEIADRDSVTCTGPPELSGIQILRSAGSASLPGAWVCHLRSDVLIAIIVLLGLTVFVIVIVRFRHRFALLRLCRTTSSSSSSCSGQNGFISSVTISNSCYGNGTASASGARGRTGVSAPGGGGESNTRYSPLIEDDLLPSSQLDEAPAEPAAASISGLDDSTTHVDTAARTLVIANGVVPLKQQSLPANIVGAGETATSCGHIDNEALLACHVTEMEESV